MAGGGGGCWALWRAENDRLARRWRRGTRPPGPDSRLAFAELLRKIQGLPPALPALPLELAVLGNALPSEVRPRGGGCDRRPSAWIERALRRVLEACAACPEEEEPERLWPRVLQQDLPAELRAPLHHLAALQGALWLAAEQPERAKGLLRLLTGAQIPGSPCGSELLSLLQMWRPHEMGESDPLVVQTIRDLKEVLWTSAAFLQGVQELEADNLHEALTFLQAAMSGLCSKRVLAQIFTLMGSCSKKIGKPQTALQYLKLALEMDFTFLPALYQAALLYRQLGLTEAELEALVLLYQALDGPLQSTSESHDPHFLIRTELLLCGCHPTAFLVPSCPSGVKYMLAQRCLQAERATEAAEHYLDLLALFQEGPLPQVLQEEGRVRVAVPFRTNRFYEKADATGICLVTAMCQIDVSSELPFPKSFLVALWLPKQQREAAAPQRCLNDLLRVHLVSTGSCGTEGEREPVAMTEAELLPQIRLLALTGRGIQFLELGRYKEALMDFQYSLHISPDSCTATLYLLHTLWKLDRRQEVVAHWPKLHSDPGLMEENTGRPFPLYLRSCVKQMEFPHKESFARDITSYLGEGGQAL